MKSAVSPLCPSNKETTNYARLCRLLVGVGSQVLRDTFDAIHPPVTLQSILRHQPIHETLQVLVKRRALNPALWETLYPIDPSSVSSANFDILLLFILLCNICGLSPPATGWDSLPSTADVSKEANIARLKYYHNVVYDNTSQASVDDATFNSHWQDISDAIIGLGGVTYKSAIDKLKNERMDSLIKVKMKEMMQDIQDRVTDEIHQMKGPLEKLSDELEALMLQHGETKSRENIRSIFEQLRADIGEFVKTSEYLASLKTQQRDTKDEAPSFPSTKGTTKVKMKERMRDTQDKITSDLHQIRSQVQNLSGNLEPLVFQQGDRKSQENIRSMFEQLRANVRKLRDNLASLETQQADTEDEDVIPSFVLARGPLALEAYQRGLQSGRTFDKRTKILLIGQDRVGKTSLGKHLRGERFNPDEPSTDGVKMMPAIKNASLQAWKNPASLDFTSAFDHKCAEVVTKELLQVSSSPEKSDPALQFTEESVTGESTKGKRTKESGTEEIRGDELTQEAETESSKDGRREQKQEQILSEVTSSGNSRRTVPIQTAEGDTEQIPGNIASLVESSLERNGPNKDDSIWPVIWDFAGQAVYHAIHPIFMSQEAIYVLALDLTRELAAPAQCRVRPLDHAEVEVTSPDTEDTNLDHILKWLDWVHSLLTAKKLGQTTEGAFPPVILVGTYADSVRKSGRDPTKVMEAALEQIYDMAPREVVDHIHDRFVIDNTKAGNPYQQEDSQIVSLRQKILELAEKMPHVKKEVPLQWLRVEEKVYEMVEKGEHYLPKKRFEEDVAEAICHFDVKDDVKELLHFLHSRGTIIHHDLPQNPDGMVVLDPQWLITVLIKIITVNPTWKAAPFIKRHYRILENEGFLSNDLLNHAFKNLKLEGARENLLEVMEKFNLICNSRGCKGRDFPYFVPCMLTLPMKDKRSKDIDNGPLPVFLTFNTNYVPSGLFCRLIALFWGWASQLCGICIEPTLYAKSARFNVSKLYHITLEAHKTLISVKLWTNADSNQEEEKRLCRELLSYLGLCRTTLHSSCQWLKSVSWNVSVQCTLCKPCPDKCLKKTDICIWHKQQGCRHPDCGHYISLIDFPASCKYSVHDAPSFCQGKLDPWTQALSDFEKGAATVNGVKDDVQDSSGNPPHLNFKLPDLKDLTTSDGCGSDFELPVDILLLTVEDCEFLACFHFLNQPSRRYHKSTGYVYYGSMGHDQENKLKTALVKCTRGSSVPDGSLIVVNDAIRALGPKAVFSVGTCIGLTPKETKLGDVVVSSKLTTFAHNAPVSRDIGNLIKHAADGWRAPLKDPHARKVNVKCDGTVLSIPPSQASSKNIIQKYSEATAVEVEGEGVFAAAHRLKTECVVVKGIKCYASENQSSSYEWDVFASVMAASVVSNILRNPSVFQDWSHYNEAQPLRLKLEEVKTNTRWNALIKVAVVVGLLAAFISVLLHTGWIGS